MLKLAKDEGAEIVDLRFCDLPGLMQHFSMPIHELTEDGFDEGFGFDGSSIRGFQEIQESDMLLIPDPNTAVIDPFREHTTLNINCFVAGPGDRRAVLARPALRREEGRGLPARAPASPTPRTSGPRPSSTSSTRRRFDQNQYSGYYYLDSVEGVWNSGRESSSTAARTSATSRATRRATSPSRRWTSTRTSAPR